MVKRGVFSGLSLWYPGISGEGPRFSQASGTCPRTVWQSGDGCCPPVIQGLRDWEWLRTREVILPRPYFAGGRGGGRREEGGSVHGLVHLFGIPTTHIPPLSSHQVPSQSQGLFLKDTDTI